MQKSIQYTTMSDSIYKLFPIHASSRYNKPGVFEKAKIIRDEAKTKTDPVYAAMQTTKFRKNIIMAGEYVTSIVDPSVAIHSTELVQEVFVFGTAPEVRKATHDLINLFKSQMIPGDVAYIISGSEHHFPFIVFHFKNHYYPVIVKPTKFRDAYSVLNSMSTTIEQTFVSYKNIETPIVLATRRFIDSMTNRKLHFVHKKTVLSSSDITRASELMYRYDLSVSNAFASYVFPVPKEDDYFSLHPDWKFTKSVTEVKRRWPTAKYLLFFHCGSDTLDIFKAIRADLTLPSVENRRVGVKLATPSPGGEMTFNDPPKFYSTKKPTSHQKTVDFWDDIASTEWPKSFLGTTDN